MPKVKMSITEEFIPCVEMALPEDKLVLAAEEAVRHNPNNAPAQQIAWVAGSGAALGLLGVTDSPQFLAVLTTKYWGVKGVRLTVGFMEETSAELRNLILTQFNAWSEFCNVRYSWSQTDPQVRVTRAGQGYWSYLGTDILQIPRNKPTMCLQGFIANTPMREQVRVIRHEVGHTNGFPHEHMRRDIIAKLDVQKTLEYFRRTQGWNATTVQQQVLTPLDERSLMGTPLADEVSIMCYQLPGSITKDGNPIPGGNDFAPQDRKFAAELYPLADDVKPQPPTPPVKPPEPGIEGTTAGVMMKLDTARKVLAIALDAGWSVTRLLPDGTTENLYTEGGDNVMHENKHLTMMARMPQWAAELETIVEPANKTVAANALPEGAQGAGFLSLIGKVNELVAALKAGNYRAVATAVRDLLNLLLDDKAVAGGGGGNDSIHFAPVQAAGLDLKKLGALLLKILPFLLEGLVG